MRESRVEGAGESTVQNIPHKEITSRIAKGNIPLKSNCGKMELVTFMKHSSCEKRSFRALIGHHVYTF